MVDDWMPPTANDDAECLSFTSPVQYTGEMSARVVESWPAAPAVYIHDVK